MQRTISDLQQAQEQTDCAQHEFRQIFDGAVNGMFVTDQTFWIQRCKPDICRYGTLSPPAPSNPKMYPGSIYSRAFSI